MPKPATRPSSTDGGHRRASSQRRPRRRSVTTLESRSTSAISLAFSPGGGSSCSTDRRQHFRRRAQALDLLLALAAPREMALERLALEVVQRAEEVRADVVLVARVVGHATPSNSSRLILSRPSRILPFTVPTGSSSSSAIWRLREPAEVGQLDRSPLLGRQHSKCPPHVARLLPPGHLDVRSLARLVALLDHIQRLAATVVHRAAAHPVDRPVVDDPEDPGPDAAARLVVAQPAAPDRQERLLHDVLRACSAFPRSGTPASRPRRHGGRRAARTRAGRPAARAA